MFIRYAHWDVRVQAQKSPQCQLWALLIKLLVRRLGSTYFCLNQTQILETKHEMLRKY